MFSPNQMTAKVKQITNGSMGSKKTLSLPE